jgi:hypothetical protein
MFVRCQSGVSSGILAKNTDIRGSNRDRRRDPHPTNLSPDELMPVYSSDDKFVGRGAGFICPATNSPDEAPPKTCN